MSSFGATVRLMHHESFWLLQVLCYAFQLNGQKDLRHATAARWSRTAYTGNLMELWDTER